MPPSAEVIPLLRKTDKCLKAIEVNVACKETSQKKLLAIVGPEKDLNPAYCLFIVSKKGATVSHIEAVLPISGKITIKENQSPSETPNNNSSSFMMPPPLFSKRKWPSYNIEMMLEEGTCEVTIPNTSEGNSFINELKKLQSDTKQGIPYWAHFYIPTFQDEKSPLGVSSATSNFAWSDEEIKQTTQNALRNLKCIHNDWVEKEMKRKENLFASYHPYKIMVVSWNVNGRSAKDSLSPIFNIGDQEPDIIVFGFQELDLSTEVYLVENDAKEVEWHHAILAGLGERSMLYTKVAHKQLIGMLLSIYVKNSNLNLVSEISCQSVGVGILGVMGNKGAVGIRLKFVDSWICFVNCHLSASASMYQRRNQDYSEICKRLLFDLPEEKVKPWLIGSEECVASKHKDDTNLSLSKFSIFDHDFVFWFGDLNYRLKLEDSIVREKLKNGTYLEMLSSDQLLDAQRDNIAFGEFAEGPIDFLPTYKFDVGTNTLDSSEKKRTPSWCDRILWRKFDRTKCLLYNSCMEMTTSDHKPLFAIFETLIRKVNLDAQAAIHNECLRELSRFENEYLPEATVSPLHLDFGQILYLEPKTLYVNIKNIGQVIANYSFIPKVDDYHICKQFIWINPTQGLLLPGEEVNIAINIMVTNEHVADLNLQKVKIDDILILHFENGKDVFISVMGKFQSTTFGLPLDMLSRLSQPVSEYGALNEEVVNSIMKNEVQHCIPYVLVRIVDFLFNVGLQTNELFLCKGTLEHCKHIRDCLDNGEDFSREVLLEEDGSDGIFSMGETLIQFLKSLPTPIIPERLNSVCNNIVERNNLDPKAVDEMLDNLFQNFPEVNRRTFIYLICFLRELLKKYREQHGEEKAHQYKENLAFLFSAVLFTNDEKDIANDKKRVSIASQQRDFLQLFLGTSEFWLKFG